MQLHSEDEVDGGDYDCDTEPILRNIDSFLLKDKRNNLVGIEVLDKVELTAEGTIEAVNDKADNKRITFEVDEWSIEQTNPPVAWIKSATSGVWYKLLRPAHAYKKFTNKMLLR